ncbi:hypothetical protein BOTBODRAFT_153640 [Botryobasidium botryosum FD-172 SS1]|uniref:Protein kinase domain-containing protein n=1 Tax=Botryobasidium botryosum (strain FD-172 SS1) TaxID=930990 RepID=A0A067MT28_BOTB1|nr:hypothetical protein BOTBODRAFT_153640 [Botryobasidium botryosum FD-172 SS1]
MASTYIKAGAHPPSLAREWGDVDPVKDPRWARHWHALAPFFSEKGYTLFAARTHGLYSIPRSPPPPASAPDPFGLYESRENGHQPKFPPLKLLYAAQDRCGRYVVIKLVSKGKEDSNELQILRLLQSEPLWSDPSNATIRILEFLEYDDLRFAVMPFCDDSLAYPFINISEYLDFTEQVLRSLSFLHRHLIAHQAAALIGDIAHENFLINYLGAIPKTETWDLSARIPRCIKTMPAPEFRSTFPVTYWLADFDSSVSFSPQTSARERLATPFQIDREQAAPEQTLGSNHTKYDPFAADVYQAARLLYALFQDIVPQVPGFLELLQDMSSYNAPSRIPMAEALDRFLTLRRDLPDERCSKACEIELRGYPPIPRKAV